MTRLAILIATLLAPWPALAHHPMGGAVPRTVWQGLLSGIGHPLIGLDHFAFLIGAGLVAASLPRRIGLPLIAVFVAAGFVGTLLHLGGVEFGPVEALVALTCLGAGLLALFRAGEAPARAWLFGLGFALAGLVHGHAFAEAVVGAEATPILAYLIGLAVVQGLVACGVMLLARDAKPVRRLGGAAVASVGALFLALAVIA